MTMINSFQIFSLKRHRNGVIKSLVLWVKRSIEFIDAFVTFFFTARPAGPDMIDRGLHLIAAPALRFDMNRFRNDPNLLKTFLRAAIGAVLVLIKELPVRLIHLRPKLGTAADVTEYFLCLIFIKVKGSFVVFREKRSFCNDLGVLVSDEIEDRLDPPVRAFRYHKDTLPLLDGTTGLMNLRYLLFLYFL